MHNKVKFVLCLLTMMICSLCRASESLKIYQNIRFGYSVQYPPKIFAPQGESENGDGQVFISKDGQASLVASGIYNVMDETLKSRFNEESRSKTRNNPSRAVTYRRFGRDSFVTSGKEDGKLFYKKIILKNETFATLLITYNERHRKEIDPLIGRIAASFHFASQGFAKASHTRPASKSKIPRPVRAPKQVAMMGQPLRAVVGVLGSADVNFDDKARQMPGVYLARDYSARYIRDLHITKDLNNGLLNIRFYYPGRPERQAPYARYMVRLFDANGSYLTSFNTAELLEIPEGKGIKTWAGYINFSFQVNVRDLRDAKIVEFGHMPQS